jgi:fused signal recognition particle receptor
MSESHKPGLFGRLRGRIASSTAGFRHELTGLAAYGDVDEQFWDLVEEALMTVDLGPEIGLRLSADIRAEAERLKMRKSKDVVEGLRTLLLQRMEWRPRGLVEAGSPVVYLVVGVNGTGKTTTLGKLAWHLRHALGRTVVLGGADTFRAAAAEQLEGWAQRAEVDIVTGPSGSDPGAVAFDTVAQARARKIDVALIDTAGRLHTQGDLMAELTKIRRVIDSQHGGAPHETLLSVDATTGQNGLRQARMFAESVPIDGIVLTKLDGTAKGGIALAIASELGIPVKLIGVGEGLEDLRPFDADDFARALLG